MPELNLNPIYGKEKILLVRRLVDINNLNAVKPALQTEHSFKFERDTDSTATKDGNINTSGQASAELELTFIGNRDSVYDMLYEAFKKDEKLEFWSVDIKKTKVVDGKTKYWMEYCRGNESSFEIPDNVEDLEEVSITVPIDGIPVGDWGTLSDSIIAQANAAYGFVDTVPQPAITPITVTPTTATMTKSATKQFTATGGDVTWSVTGTGATISTSGLLTTDATATGTITVTATSKTEPTNKATATVTIG